MLVQREQISDLYLFSNWMMSLLLLSCLRNSVFCDSNLTTSGINNANVKIHNLVPFPEFKCSKTLAAN